MRESRSQLLLPASARFLEIASRGVRDFEDTVGTERKSHLPAWRKCCVNDNLAWMPGIFTTQGFCWYICWYIELRCKAIFP